MLLSIGQLVYKKKGYRFEGYVVTKFPTRSGLLRVVVEHRTEIGMLHIYSPEQLELLDDNNS